MDELDLLPNLASSHHVIRTRQAENRGHSQDLAMSADKLFTLEELKQLKGKSDLHLLISGKGEPVKQQDRVCLRLMFLLY